MDVWIDIRRKARACHEEALITSKGDRRAHALIEAALQNDDLEVRNYEPGSIVNKGVLGFLDRLSKLVNVAKHQDRRDAHVVIAHEIGHYRLHQDPISEVTVQSSCLGGDAIDDAAGKVEGYSPRERKEVQADVFAGEFFCPAHWLRDEFVIRGKRPSEIAAELDLPLNLVMNQLIRALLLPPLRPARIQPPGITIDLDESQKTAAIWNNGPLLVDAGPGTGKTRTLVHRVKHLLDQGTSAGSILALTFSNKAAEEMRERLSAMNADAAIEMWVGTFHAFGLELVTKWPDSLGRTAKVRVLDQTGSLALLEDNLARLPLYHYQNLYEPAFELVNVLRAISRCKDELISPSQYLAASKAALAAAKNEDETIDAEKAIEVAAIYRIYEDELKNIDAVDFGDLVLLALKLVEENAAVKTYISGFKHILVDEYQDVNLSSARLLRAICSSEASVWVVADQRQSIYRFRGAEPSNVSRFTSEFSGKRHSLSNNYRSFGPIVRTFEKFSSTMGKSGKLTGSWVNSRGDNGDVTLTVTPTLASEAEAIRDKIEKLRAKGITYANQAILARTHLTLARITGVLEKLGIPLLYLGDLFERDEIRTLLSLVAIDAEFGGIGLMRVAALPAYQATRDDALTVIRWARSNNVKIAEALTRITEIDNLSAASRVGLLKLGAELTGLANTSPWTVLTTWLFERSDYLLPLLISNDAPSQQKLIAIYHLLKVCSEQAASGDHSRKRFLNRIRRIEALNQDSAYRAIAAEATDMDAVRVMTIHGSKGLEFQAVHLPALATKYMPTPRKGTRCPPPPTLAKLDIQASDHDAEEECLFFVALSRARDYLSLSRAERYTSVNASESKFLPRIAGCARATRHNGTGAVFSNPSQHNPPDVQERYDVRKLELYMKCPARYRYEAVEELRGPRDDSAYMRFHHSVYATVRWVEERRHNGHACDKPTALARLADEWNSNGPVGHAFESYYRTTAEIMISSMATTMATETAKYDRQEWAVPINGRYVVITPDRVLLAPNGTVRVQRIRTGRESDSETEKPVYALLRLGAAECYLGKAVTVEILYLSTGKIIQVPPAGDDKSIKKYADAIAEIEGGHFDPKPDPRACPKCEFYFTCRG